MPMRLAVCTTIPPYKMFDDSRYWGYWLDNAHQLCEQAALVDCEVQFFAALELDRRGQAPFAELLFRMEELDDATFWTFSLDTGDYLIHTGNRLLRIATGQNLSRHWAMESGADAMLFLAADTQAPDDVVPRMLELDWPICAPDTPTYCLDGPRVEDASYPPEWDVREHMASAAAIWLDRSIFVRLPWRTDSDAGMTDDPCMHHDALALGWPTRVRHDVLARHFPEAVGAIETRHSEETRTLRVRNC